MTERDTRYLKQYEGEMYESTVLYKTDLLDRKILFLLSMNARLSYTAMARTLKTTREVVAYRMKRLQEEHVLLGLLTDIDERKLGFLAHLVFIKLRAIGNERELMKNFLKIKNVTSLKKSSGEFDISLRITTKTLEEFDATFEDLIAKNGDMIGDYVILNRLKGGFLGYDFLLEKEHRDEILLLGVKDRKGRSFQKELKRKKDGVVSLDAKDKSILALLQFDARLSVLDVARKVALAPKSVENRIKKMIQSGVILSFAPEIACNRLGYQYYDLLLYMKNVNEQKFLAFLRGVTNGYWYTKQIGAYNYKVSIFARDTTHFHHILDEIRAAFVENIIRFSYVMVFNQYFYEPKIE